jgi:hypothetical protein
VEWGALERVGRGRYRIGIRLWQIGGIDANLDAFTEVQWVIVRGDLPQYPF